MPRLKGPVPQVQAKEGPMPHLVKKRRSGWAVLAVGALVASVLAFGATPAAAGSQQADAQATWTACLGPATADQGFTDVTMDNNHYDNINCLRYYGVTSGKTDDTYDPSGNVTRSQMALFLTRMAGQADVEIGEAGDQGFTDLVGEGADRVAAINSLAAADIMPGRTAATFDPEGLVTRADMALHMFRFLDLALDSVLIDMLPDSVETSPRDGVGKIELNDDDGDGVGDRVDDYFGDVRRTLPAHMDDIIGAVYELGVTVGKNGMVGENGIFDPQGNVTRAQMATFIMRTLGHTNLRPEGLTAQQTFGETQVSVRAADFEPIVNARVEVFRSTFARDAFDRSGRCIDRFVADSNPSFSACEIDAGDARTDVAGNVELQPGSGGGYATIVCQTGTAYLNEDDPTYRLDASGLVDPDAEYRLWAWMGSFGDTVGSDTDLFEAVPANQQHSRTAAESAVFSGGSRYTVKMGRALIYEIQLVDYLGRPTGPNPSGNQDFTVTVRKRAYDVDAQGAETPGSVINITNVERRSPDSDGKIRIVVFNPDPVIGSNNPDFDVTVEVRRYEAAGVLTNPLRFVDTTGASGTATTGFDAAGYLIGEAEPGTGPDDARRYIGAQASVERFSDNTPSVTSLSVSPRAAGRVLASRNQNSISVTVLDQYGNPFRGGAAYAATNSGTDPLSKYPGNADLATSGALVSNSSGRVYFNYNYGAVVADTELIAIIGAQRTVNDVTIPAPAGAGNATVYWADISGAGSGGAVPLLLADPSSRRLFAAIGGDRTPTAFPFGADDTFLVSNGATDLDELEITALSLAQFQEVLMVANSPSPLVAWRMEDNAIIDMLTWDGFDNNRPNDRATWTLTGLSCTPPAGADAETYDNR